MSVEFIKLHQVCENQIFRTFSLYLQTCFKLLKQLASNLWIKSLDNQVALSQSFHNLRKFPQIRQLLWGRGAKVEHILCILFKFSLSNFFFQTVLSRKQLYANILWKRCIKPVDNLQRTCYHQAEQVMRTHPDIGLMTARQQASSRLAATCAFLTVY